MTDVKRGDDAEDHAPKPGAPAAKPETAGGSAKQDAPNYEPRIDGGRAEPVEKMNSANDE
jgi:hypothetical protein